MEGICCSVHYSRRLVQRLARTWAWRTFFRLRLENLLNTIVNGWGRCRRKRFSLWLIHFTSSVSWYSCAKSLPIWLQPINVSCAAWSGNSLSPKPRYHSPAWELISWPRNPQSLSLGRMIRDKANALQIRAALQLGHTLPYLSDGWMSYIHVLHIVYLDMRPFLGYRWQTIHWTARQRLVTWSELCFARYRNNYMLVFVCASSM